MHGRFYRGRTWLSWLLLAIMFAGPFVRINGNPLLLFNVVERKFVILGQIFWPQDMIMFAVALLIFVTGILVFTAAYGRLWCGWTCPQTVLMEMVFRKIEYLIEGDSHQQRALDKAPWTAAKIRKKVGKHAIFFGLSFIVGNTLLAYIIGTEQLFQIVTDSPAKHLEGLTAMILFTLVFYAIFARFREQACTFICPYGRLQSTLLDENTIVVAYDYKRGEKRGPWRRGQPLEQRQAAGHGDCIACRQCVAVCPTGIDIRNGTQMECVHCTACIDACDDVMDKNRASPRPHPLRLAQRHRARRTAQSDAAPGWLHGHPAGVGGPAGIPHLHALGRADHLAARPGRPLPANAQRPLQQPLHHPRGEQDLARNPHPAQAGKHQGRVSR